MITTQGLLLLVSVIVVYATFIGGAAIHVSSRLFGGSLAHKRGFGAALLIAFSTLASATALCAVFRSDAWPFFVTLIAVVPVMFTYRVGFARGLVITGGAWVVTWIGYFVLELLT